MPKNAPVPNDRPPDDPCRLAYDAWWRALTLQGDPIRRYNLVDEAFEAGWRSAMKETKEAEAFLRKIRSEEQRECDEDRRWRDHFDSFGRP
jgi:hypothetical protein